jgi:hypothetical protein
MGRGSRVGRDSPEGVPGLGGARAEDRAEALAAIRESRIMIAVANVVDPGK